MCLEEKEEFREAELVYQENASFFAIKLAMCVEEVHMCLEKESQRIRKEEKETELASRGATLNEPFAVKNTSQHMFLKSEGLHLEQERQLTKVMLRHQTAERKVKAKQERYRQQPRK
ncbi:hypothetical protein [Candidatus Cardinium hertigii]|uniref:Uncharacterized protein n=1 Tax=Candidatus Cardinium hertigii TaxID=247481 RepID=A0A2Z3LCV1_9BACT|nr:hypothetical protein [Candidatus Cardinium hertigii]AWN82002.1 hypothetical protein DK880_00691 [Candidatus Cardinium hertigii]